MNAYDSVARSHGRRQWRALLTLLIASTLVPTAGGAIVRSGPQGALDTPRAGSARSCVDGSGRIAVAYVRYDVTESELKLQRFDAAGAKDGAPTLLAGGESQGNGSFDISCALDGEIVVVWETADDGDGRGVLAQVYDATGAALTGFIQVNALTSGRQRSPRVTVSDSDEMLFAWESDDFNGGIHDEEVYVRLFDLTGVALSAEQTVHVLDGVDTPDVTALSSGDYAVVWTDLASESVLMRRVDSLGAPAGAPVTIAAPGGGFFDETGHARLSRLPGGGFLAQWADVVGHDAHYVMQRFDDDGAATGAEVLLQIGSDTTVSGASANHPLVGATADDGVVVVRTSLLDGSSSGLTAQLYDAGDTPAADAFMINAGRLGEQGLNSLAVTADGDFLATWDDRDDTGAVVLERNHVAFICAGGDPACDPCLGLGTVDSDGDGLPDQCDPCTRQTGSPTQTFLEKSDLRVRRIFDSALGQDEVRLKASFLLAPTVAFSDLDLPGEGMGVIVSAPDRGNIVDSELLTGPFDKNTGVGWKSAKNGRKVRYQDKAGLTPGGVTLVTVKDAAKGAAGGEVRLKLRAKQPVFALAPEDAVAEVIVRLGDAAASSDGRCAEAEFDAGQCEIRVSGSLASQLRCREK